MAVQVPYHTNGVTGEPVDKGEIARAIYNQLLNKCQDRIWRHWNDPSKSLRYINLYSYIHNRLWREGWGQED